MEICSIGTSREQERRKKLSLHQNQIAPFERYTHKRIVIFVKLNILVLLCQSYFNPLAFVEFYQLFFHLLFGCCYSSSRFSLILHCVRCVFIRSNLFLSYAECMDVCFSLAVITTTKPIIMFCCSYLKGCAFWAK